MRHLMQYVRDATANGRIGIIFPSGRLAKRVGLNLVERPWMASAAMIARKFKLPVVPVHISARNSLLFYLSLSHSQSLFPSISFSISFSLYLSLSFSNSFSLSLTLSLFLSLFLSFSNYFSLSLALSLFF